MMSTSHSSERPVKKIRTQKDSSIDVIYTQRCYLSPVPFELFAEILLHTSPKDVLAVARCSKYFCATLLQESSVFIWRRLRATCKPEPIPDPTPNLTESAFAALLFDGGECEVCGRWTSLAYASFAVRLRVCARGPCRILMLRRVVRPSEHIILTWLPALESSTFLRGLIQCFFSFPRTQFFTMIGRNGVIYPAYRSEDWTMAFEMYKQATRSPTSLQEYLAKRQGEIDRLPLLMSFALVLSEWSSKRQHAHKSMKAKNNAITQTIAKKEGWDIIDLLNAQSYRELHQHRTNILEEVQESDYKLIRSTVEAQILKNMERRKRRLEENSYRCRREDVERYFNRLSARYDDALPTLPMFRKLPTIKLGMQSETLSPKMLIPLFPLVPDSLHVDLTKWRESARADLAGVLGYPSWNTASRKLHPADRLTARFRCSKCHKVSSKCGEDGSFDFAGACAHQCHHLDKRGRAKAEWQANQFVKDDKAIAAILEVLSLCGVDAEEQASFDVVKTLDVRIMCISCESAIVMGFRSVAGHSQRHDRMQLSLLSSEELASILIFPIEYNLCSNLMGPKQNMRSLREMRSYGCRHCLQRKKHAALLDTTVNTDLESEHPSKKWGTKKKRYTFDGMRSHVKEKHGIQDMRDEDMYNHSHATLWCSE